MEHDEDAKLVMLGDLGVGKSSLLVRFADNVFNDDNRSIIGLDLKVKTIELQGIRMRLSLWDTAGQERFRTVTSSYYRNARGLVLVFDLSDRLSFEGLRNWCQEIALHVQDPMVLLVGNKSDLPRAIDLGEVETFAREHSYLYVETSAKLGTNVDQAFFQLAAQVHRRRQQRYRSSSLLAKVPKHRRRC